MKQIIRLTESDLNKIVEEAVRRSIKEGTVNEYGMKDFGKDMLGLGLGAGAFGGAVAGNAYLHSDDPEIDPQQAEINQTVKDELGQDALSPRGSMPSDTISWEKANRFESVISKAISESIENLIDEGFMGDMWNGIKQGAYQMTHRPEAMQDYYKKNSNSQRIRDKYANQERQKTIRQGLAKEKGLDMASRNRRKMINQKEGF